MKAAEWGRGVLAVSSEAAFQAAEKRFLKFFDQAP